MKPINYLCLFFFSCFSQTLDAQHTILATGQVVDAAQHDTNPKFKPSKKTSDPSIKKSSLPTIIINETAWAYNSTCSNSAPGAPFSTHAQDQNNGTPPPIGCVNNYWTGGYCFETGMPAAITSSASQEITIPNDCTIFLKFEYLLTTPAVDVCGLDAGGDASNDFSYINFNATQIVNINHDLSNQTWDLCNGTGVGFVEQCIDISDFAGQTITITLGNVNGGDLGQGNVYFACLRIESNDEPCCEALGGTFGNE